MDLAEFLQARLDEDKQRARAAVRHWAGVRVESATAAEEEHITRHGPARVLAEVEAKRLLLVRWTVLQARIDAEPDPAKRERLALARHGLDMFVYQFGAIHAGHPDYQEEWRP